MEKIHTTFQMGEYDMVVANMENAKNPITTLIPARIQPHMNKKDPMLLSAIYSHPDLYTDISPDLRKVLKGKSCFNIRKTTPKLLEEVEEVLKKGINKYKELEWI